MPEVVPTRRFIAVPGAAGAGTGAAMGLTSGLGLSRPLVPGPRRRRVDLLQVLACQPGLRAAPAPGAADQRAAAGALLTWPPGTDGQPRSAARPRQAIIQPSAGARRARSRPGAGVDRPAVVDLAVLRSPQPFAPA